jgi:hypothetical protein
MTNEISNKSTKSEILDAYESLLKSIKDQKREASQKVQEEIQNKTIVKKSSELSNEQIIKDVAGLKISISGALDKVTDSMLEKYREFTQLQDAISVQQKQLKELYQINVEAETLEALIASQKELKARHDAEMAAGKLSFEQEMAARKESWKSEQVIYETNRKEQDEQVKKNRKREEEEYAYTLKVTRKKEEDTFNEKKTKWEKDLEEKKIRFEKEIAERESLVQSAEAELADLRQQAGKFPVQLEQAIKQAEKAMKDKLDLEYKHESELAAQKSESEQKLKDQTIASLREKIKEQDVLIKQLSEKTSAAETGMKEIAIKALDSSTKRIVEARTEEGK